MSDMLLSSYHLAVHLVYRFLHIHRWLCGRFGSLLVWYDPDDRRWWSIRTRLIVGSIEPSLIFQRIYTGLPEFPVAMWNYVAIGIIDTKQCIGGSVVRCLDLPFSNLHHFLLAPWCSRLQLYCPTRSYSRSSIIIIISLMGALLVYPLSGKHAREAVVMAAQCLATIDTSRAWVHFKQSEFLYVWVVYKVLDICYIHPYR